jgi:hypothetical protein
VLLNNPLGDGEAQTCASHVPAACLIDSIETLEDLICSSPAIPTPASRTVITTLSLRLPPPIPSAYLPLVRFQRWPPPS